MARSLDKRKVEGSHHLRRAWRESRGGLIVIILFGVLINLLKLATPFYTLLLFDRVRSSRSVETLIMLTIVAVFAVLAMIALELVRRRMFARWGAWIEQEFGPRLFLAGITGQGRRTSASATQSLSDLSILRSFVSKSAAPWLDVVWAPFFLFAVYLVHPLMGVIGSVAVSLLIALAVLQEMMTREPRRASSSASSDAKEILTAAERNNETVSALSMATNLTERWRRSLAVRFDERDRSDARNSYFAALGQALKRCLNITALGVGLWLVLGNLFTLGGVLAARIMIGIGFKLVQKAARNWRALINARGAYKRIKALLAMEEVESPSVTDAASVAALIVDNVTYRYTDQKSPVFRRITVTMERGEILCVTGTSATGKTTLSRLLTGVLMPRSGQVRLGDIEIGRLPPELLSLLVGYLPQEIHLFQGSVRDNIARMGEGNFEDVVDAARLANIHEAIVRLPQGYDTEIDDETSALSGGERKRVALARAFYGRPRLVVLDEPEANLDRPSLKALIEAIRTLKAQGSTVVITTQSKKLGKIADKVLILGGGNVQLRDGDAVEGPSNTDAAADSKAGRRAGRIRPMS